MAKVAIVTDSTAYLPNDILNEYSIHVVPLQVLWDGETYRDGVDILPDEFYQKLQSSKTIPSTSQPSPQAFLEVYSKLSKENYDILSIHISSNLSGTVGSAEQAKSMLPDANIMIVDSRTTAMHMGFQIIMAAKAASTGSSMQECKRITEQTLIHSNVNFAVNTLEFLHRGGRIGGATAFLGTILDLKPILEIRDGRIEAIDRVRTMNKAIPRLIELAEPKFINETPVQFAAMHANAYDQAKQLLDLACEKYKHLNIQKTYMTELSPVIGTHTGPGTISFIYMAGIEEPG